jgi:2-keto-3-deoxy-L-rhamnonate aldolase RhmA
MTIHLRNPLAETLAAGRLGLALIVQKATCVDIALAAQSCGFDALSADLEHSVIPEAAAAQICITALHAGVTPLVRVPAHDTQCANRMLDAGALGIIAPHVESADEARAIVSACKFAPRGTRSATDTWPHFGYRSHEAVAARAALDAATTVVVMLETPQAVERADQIAAVPGVDIVHVGTVDLCDALGIPGRIDDARVTACLERVIAACRALGKVAGIGGVAGSPEVVKRVVALGARFLTAGIDWDFMLSAARQRVQALREPSDSVNRPWH